PTHQNVRSFIDENAIAVRDGGSAVDVRPDQVPLDGRPGGRAKSQNAVNGVAGDEVTGPRSGAAHGRKRGGVKIYAYLVRHGTRAGCVRADKVTLDRAVTSLAREKIDAHNEVARDNVVRARYRAPDGSVGRNAEDAILVAEGSGAGGIEA